MESYLSIAMAQTLRNAERDSGEAIMNAASEDPMRDVTVESDDISLPGHLRLPEDSIGVVLFAHGSGSGRNSPRNQYVAEKLGQSGVGTLLIDLMTEKEQAQDIVNGRLRFDIDFLTARMEAAMRWLQQEPTTQALPIGLFGSSTGAAAALRAAVKAPETIRAVVSRGGRVDLAVDGQMQLRTPTLLIVGERDELVLELNAQFREQIAEGCETELRIVPEAGHLFEEPGALEAVADHARDWFVRYLSSG